MEKKIKIVFTGGGTGGHLFPIIAILRELRRLGDKKKIELHYLGPGDALSGRLLAEENVIVHNVVTGKIRRYFSFENITDVLFKMPLGFIQSFFILLFLRPVVVFSKGGSGSVQVAFCANVLRIPIFLHESDVVPGLSNRIVSGWAEKIFISFQKTEYFDLSKTILVGNPIEKELLEGNKQSAQELFDLSSKKPVLLFMGGSQGAKVLNDFVLNILNNLLENYELIHVCGTKNYQQTKAESEVIANQDIQDSYHLYAFLNEIELKHAYKVASFVVSRAGAGSIFEIAAAGLPSILVPLPSSAGNHQSKNAYAYAQTGAAIVIEQDNLNPHFFLSKLHYLLSHPEELKVMKDSALRFSKPLAAKAIAREILEYLGD